MMRRFIESLVLVVIPLLLLTSSARAASPVTCNGEHSNSDLSTKSPYAYHFINNDVCTTFGAQSTRVDVYRFLVTSPGQVWTFDAETTQQEDGIGLWLYGDQYGTHRPCDPKPIAAGVLIDPNLPHYTRLYVRINQIGSYHLAVIAPTNSQGPELGEYLLSVTPPPTEAFPFVCDVPVDHTQESIRVLPVKPVDGPRYVGGSLQSPILPSTSLFMKSFIFMADTSTGDHIKTGWIHIGSNNRMQALGVDVAPYCTQSNPYYLPQVLCSFAEFTAPTQFSFDDPPVTFEMRFTTVRPDGEIDRKGQTMSYRIWLSFNGFFQTPKAAPGGYGSWEPPIISQLVTFEGFTPDVVGSGVSAEGTDSIIRWNSHGNNSFATNPILDNQGNPVYSTSGTPWLVPYCYDSIVTSPLMSNLPIPYEVSPCAFPAPVFSWGIKVNRPEW